MHILFVRLSYYCKNIQIYFLKYANLFPNMQIKFIIKTLQIKIVLCRVCWMKDRNVMFLTKDIHKELEKKIAKFHNREDAILYSSCFDSNAGFFEALLSPEDAVVSDELNHASIIDGIRLCKAERLRYNHRNMEGKSIKSIN